MASPLPPGISISQVELAYSAQKNNFAALAFLIYELCITFDIEVAYIWSKPNRSWIKWMFIVIRYVSLASVLIFILVSETPFAKPKTEARKRGEFIGLTVLAHLVMVAIEAILMARVYAMFERRRWVLMLFIALLVTASGTLLYGIISSASAKVIDSARRGIPPKELVYSTAVAAGTQLIIVVLTIIRARWSFRLGQKYGKLIVLLVRDGGFTFLVVFVVSVINMKYTLQGNMIVRSLYPWYFALISSAGCRVTMNLHMSNDIPAERGNFTTGLFSGHSDESELPPPSSQA